MTPEQRALTSDERDSLTERLAQARRETRMALIKTGAASALVCGVLALLTILASDAPAIVIVIFWTVLALVFTAWIGLPWRRLMVDQTRVLDDALRANRANVTTIRSARLVEFEEEEDEGACYVFEVAPAACVVVIGQEYYDDVDFPNTDFSIVEVLGTSGRPVDKLLVKRGSKLTPERVVPARVKRTIEWPDDLTVVPAPIDRIEDALRAGA